MDQFSNDPNQFPQKKKNDPNQCPTNVTNTFVKNKV
jgi:hypothetical protein